METLSEIRKYKFNDGTIVYVRIDFAKNQVSFLESPDLKNGKYEYKKWLFAERGDRYLNGWRNIIGAIDHIIQESQKEMQAYQDKKAKDKEDLLLAVMLNREEAE